MDGFSSPTDTPTWPPLQQPDNSLADYLQRLQALGAYYGMPAAALDRQSARVTPGADDIPTVDVTAHAPRRELALAPPPGNALRAPGLSPPPDPGNPLTAGTPTLADAWSGPAQPHQADTAGQPSTLWGNQTPQWQGLVSPNAQESDPAWRSLIAPAPNTTYSGVLPLATDDTTGALRLAMPGAVRDFAKGVYDAVRGPATGTMTPEATMALASLVDPLARPQEGTLSAFGGSLRGEREAEIAAKAKTASTLDDVIAATEGKAASPVPPANALAQAVQATENATAKPNALAPTLEGVVKATQERAPEVPPAGPAAAPVAPVAPAPTAPSGASNRAAARAAAKEAAAKEAAAQAVAAVPPPQPISSAPALQQVESNGVRNEDRVSTRIPTAAPPKGAAPESIVDPHTTPDLRIGIDAARDAPEAFEKNGMLLRGDNFPDLPVKGMRNPANITDTAINHMADNLVWLHDQMREKFGQATVDRAANWYEGAHKIAMRIAAATGYEPRQIAAVMASLSPQKDWYQNADLADRLVDIIKNQSKTAFSPQMTQWANDYVAQKQAEIAKDRRNGKDSTADKKEIGLANMQMSMASLRNGVTLSEINDPDTRAVFLRAYDEAHHNRAYPIVTPEGDFGPIMTSEKTGLPQNIGWGSFKEIQKAMSALDSSDIAHLSRLLGGNHKVRSFYDNIISPNSQFDDTTIDTHAINAAHLRPMGGSHPVVNFGLGMGGSSSNATGAGGGYAIYHEAYRRAAEKLGLLPRQLQSITWEAVRGLFSPEQKRDDALVADVDAIWQSARNGKISADDARKMVSARAKGMDAPSWYVPPPKPAAPDEEPPQ